ncbi:ABC transporter ATP-binding protein [Pseudanabaena sp. FACHB-1998]|uniref:ABC transporter ATP-binding protein n=1 Tax=Pseudanabaena sp. FACHB-1998 TaxID=2692858 RepID=UPI001680DFAF|nr:ABC transporter ATP-binding protein [Pseudanabaena sp. FACHB-1998]MBD2179284.1 ABC transporter ATP-binding protein [Pseudanabaena sp. FACHB-1998]
MDNSSSLIVDDLRVQFKSNGRQLLTAVDGVNLSVRPGEITGLVGESGSGKSVTCMSILRLLQEKSCYIKGHILWRNRRLLDLDENEMRKVRGREIAMIFQNPQSSLNPVYTIGEQMIDILQLHRNLSKKEAQEEAITLLRSVRIPDAEKRIHDYPHQFSGGMCQRIVIAMAISCQPKLLIADEPTASLDVTIQAQIMDLLMELRQEYDMSILLVSHDLGLIAQMCDRVSVMYLGRVVESAPVKSLYASPLHPYTQALLEAIPMPDPNSRGRPHLLGEVPKCGQIPVGCRFQPRCPVAFDKCIEIDPESYKMDTDHFVACLNFAEGRRE